MLQPWEMTNLDPDWFAAPVVSFLNLAYFSRAIFISINIYQVNSAVVDISIKRSENISAKNIPEYQYQRAPLRTAKGSSTPKTALRRSSIRPLGNLSKFLSKCHPVSWSFGQNILINQCRLATLSRPPWKIWLLPPWISSRSSDKRRCKLPSTLPNTLFSAVAKTLIVHFAKWFG